MLQKLYKSKTYLRNEEWDVIWYLGGRNRVTIGEKDSRFYLLPADFLLAPADRKTVVTDLLPFGLIQGEHASSESPVPLHTLADLSRVFPEFFPSNCLRI